MVTSLHPTSYLMIFMLVSLIFYAGLALTVPRGEIYVSTRELQRNFVTRIILYVIKWRRSITEIAAVDQDLAF